MAKEILEDDCDWPPRVGTRLVLPSDNLWYGCVVERIYREGRPVLAPPPDPEQIRAHTALLCRICREEGYQTLNGKTPNVATARHVKAAKESLRAYGFKALWSPMRGLDDPRTPDDIAAFGELRSYLQPFLQRLHDNAATAPARSRAKANAQLKAILAAGIPEQRGVGPAGRYEPNEQIYTYYNRLLRWELLPAAVKETPSDRLFSERVAEAAAAYGLDAARARKFLGLNEEFEAYRSKIGSAKQEARRDAASLFGITEPTFRKLLTEWKKNPVS